MKAKVTHWYSSPGPEGSHSSEVLLFTFYRYSKHRRVGVAQLVVHIYERKPPLAIR